MQINLPRCRGVNILMMLTAPKRDLTMLKNIVISEL